jgi:hypothetical protein
VIAQNLQDSELDKIDGQDWRNLFSKGLNLVVKVRTEYGEADFEQGI